MPVRRSAGTCAGAVAASTVRPAPGAGACGLQAGAPAVEPAQRLSERVVQYVSRAGRDARGWTMHNMTPEA